MARGKPPAKSAKAPSTATIGFAAGQESSPELQLVRATRHGLPPHPASGPSSTTFRASAFLQTGGTLQVMAERHDIWSKDDDLRWQKSEQHVCNL